MVKEFVDNQEIPQFICHLGGREKGPSAVHGRAHLGMSRCRCQITECNPFISWFFFLSLSLKKQK